MKSKSSQRRQWARGHVKTLVPLTGLFVMLALSSLVSLVSALPAGFLVKTLDQEMLGIARGLTDKLILANNLNDSALIERNRDALKYLGIKIKINSLAAVGTVSEQALKGLMIGNVQARRLTASTVEAVSSTASTINEPLRSTRSRVPDLLAWLKNMLDNLTQSLSDYRRIISDNWRAFLSGRSGRSVVPTLVEKTQNQATTSTAVPVTRAEVEREVKADMLEWLLSQNLTVNPGSQPGGSESAIIVTPLTGDPKRDAEIKKSLQRSFSDEVTVNFDETGQAGVITPVFKKSSGIPYLFLLTPLRRE